MLEGQIRQNVSKRGTSSRLRLTVWLTRSHRTALICEVRNA